MSKIDWSKAPEGATHWSPANGKGRLEAYWRPDGDGMYDCWAVTDSYGGNKWQRNRTDLPEYAMARPTVWIGEGPPPVGAVCEFRKYAPLDSGEWIAGDIRYLSDCTIVIGGDKCEHVHHPRTLEFRPIRTPEQIAAEKVSKQLESDLAMYGTSFALTNDDGSITRLDPTKIVMRMQEAK